MFKVFFLFKNLFGKIDDIEKRIEKIQHDLMILKIKSRQEQESLKDFFLGE